MVVVALLAPGESGSSSAGRRRDDAPGSGLRLRRTMAEIHEVDLRGGWCWSNFLLLSSSSSSSRPRRRRPPKSNARKDDEERFLSAPFFFLSLPWSPARAGAVQEAAGPTCGVRKKRSSGWCWLWWWGWREEA